MQKYKASWCRKVFGAQRRLKNGVLPICSLHVGGSATPVAAALNYNLKKYNTNLQNQAKGPPNRSTYVLHQGSTNQSFMVQEGNWCPKDAEEYLRYLLQFACQRARLVTARWTHRHHNSASCGRNSAYVDKSKKAKQTMKVGKSDSVSLHTQKKSDKKE